MAIARVSRSQAHALLGSEYKPTKYLNEPTHLDGDRFDSAGEATRYAWLKWSQHAGHISSLARQVAFPLHVCNLDTGELTVVGEYVCDFDYVDTATGQRVVEDWKGAETLPLAKWKMRHLKAEYGIAVLENRKQPLRLRRSHRKR